VGNSRPRLSSRAKLDSARWTATAAGKFFATDLHRSNQELSFGAKRGIYSRRFLRLMREATPKAGLDFLLRECAVGSGVLQPATNLVEHVEVVLDMEELSGSLFSSDTTSCLAVRMGVFKISIIPAKPRSVLISGISVSKNYLQSSQP
jgi:hypothetical protein